MFNAQIGNISIISILKPRVVYSVDKLQIIKQCIINFHRKPFCS